MDNDIYLILKFFLRRILSLEKKKKIKPQRPRGFEDLSGSSLSELVQLRDSIQKVYSLYGFEPLETGIIEYSDVIGSFLPDQDRPNEGVFSFEDDDKRWVSLRYDLTSGLARYVAENFDSLPKPYRRYQSGWVFRNEKPGPGRYRQFYQINFEGVLGFFSYIQKNLNLPPIYSVTSCFYSLQIDSLNSGHSQLVLLLKKDFQHFWCLCLDGEYL